MDPAQRMHSGLELTVRHGERPCPLNRSRTHRHEERMRCGRAHNGERGRNRLPLVEQLVVTMTLSL